MGVKQTEALKLALEALQEVNYDQAYAAEISAIRDALAERPAQQQALPDFIAGAFGVSRGTAYDLMREALAEQPAQQQYASRAEQDLYEDENEDEQPAQQTIHCKHRRENNGVCPHHNLHCGWPKCNEPEQPSQQQEPLFWYDEEEGWLHDNHDDAPSGCIPLYTSPPNVPPARASKPWVGLTSEDKVEILRATGEAAVLILTEAKLREKNT